MGDLNLDLTSSKRFLAIPYLSAAVGAVAGVHMTAATSALGLVTAGAVGAVAGGIGIPMAVVGVAVLGYVGFVGLRETIKAIKKEGPTVPLGMAVIGLSCAKALFVTPFQAAAKILKGFGKKADKDAAPPAKMVEGDTSAPSKLSGKKAAKAFNEPKPEKTPKQKPPAPKPPQP